jgi:hypothetical protein
LNRHHGANGKDSVGSCGTQHVVCAKGRGFWWYVDVRVSSRYRLASLRKIWFIHARRRSSGLGCAFVQQSRSKRMSALVSRCTSSAAGSPSIVMLGGHHCSEQGSEPQDLLMIANRRLSVAVKRQPRKRAVYPPPSTVCLLTLDALPPPGSPVPFQADGPKSPVVAGTSETSLSHRSAVPRAAGGSRVGKPESKVVSAGVANGRKSLLRGSKTRDWGVGPWCREQAGTRAGGVQWVRVCLLRTWDFTTAAKRFGRASQHTQRWHTSSPVVCDAQETHGSKEGINGGQGWDSKAKASAIGRLMMGKRKCDDEG